MPKHETDPEDPLELTGVELITLTDTTQDMAECLIEEFMRLGYNPKQVLALFRQPHYIGMHRVWRRMGEAWTRQRVEDVFRRWGRIPASRSPGANDAQPSGINNEQPAAAPPPESA
jgi:hypothetical protein